MRRCWTSAKPSNEAEIALKRSSLPERQQKRAGEMDGEPGAHRESIIEPILKQKGWSILDWANEARVDYKTAAGYLNGTTKTYRSSRKKLADALGIAPEALP
jgi:lambda repressor-like predicted transcriptional regulator